MKTIAAPPQEELKCAPWCFIASGSGVCRTDLHIVDGELTQPTPPPVPELLDAAIIFAPVGSLVPVALKAVRKGGTMVCGGIHMSMIPAFEYELLCGERTLCSVANLTRQDAVEFIELARTMPVVAKATVFPLVQGAAVLIP